MHFRPHFRSEFQPGGSSNSAKDNSDALWVHFRRAGDEGFEGLGLKVFRVYGFFRVLKIRVARVKGF